MYRLYALIPLFILSAILISIKYLSVKNKSQNCNKTDFIVQPKFYLYGGVFPSLAVLCVGIYILLMPKEMIVNYSIEGRVIVFSILIIFSILFSLFVFLQLNWRIEIREDEFEYRNLFRRKKVYKFSEVEVKELSRCTRFYRNGKHIVGISFLQDNCDALEKAIYKYRKEEKKKQE